MKNSFFSLYVSLFIFFSFFLHLFFVFLFIPKKYERKNFHLSFSYCDYLCLRFPCRHSSHSLHSIIAALNTRIQLLLLLNSTRGQSQKKEKKKRREMKIATTATSKLRFQNIVSLCCINSYFLLNQSRDMVWNSYCCCFVCVFRYVVGP